MSENEIKTNRVVLDFIRAYKTKPQAEDNLSWLKKQFSAYPALWASEEARNQDAEAIVTAAEDYYKSKQKLEAHIASGKSREAYIVSNIEAASAAAGTLNVGKYAGEIDHAISRANEEMASRLLTREGTIDMNPQLKGNIMETDQANTFNIDAAAKESHATAEVRLSHEKNSVDIRVTKADGSQQRYQAKCSKTGEQAEKAFQQGEYRGQRKLVAKGQTGEVPNSTDHLEADGVKSRAREHDEYRKMQEKAQQEGKIPEYNWNDADKVAIAKSIGKKAAWAGVLAVGFQGARILGRRVWNFVTGKENQSVEEDLKEFVTSSVESAGGAGLAVAVTGGITVAAKSGWLGKVLQATPVGRIANAACIAIENVKILYKLGKGEITGPQALDQAGNATCSLIGSLALGAKGAAAGAAIGTVLGPVGTAIGGITGGIVGGIVGSSVGSVLYNGAKKVCEAVASAAKKVWEAAKSVGRILNPLTWFN